MGALLAGLARGQGRPRPQLSPRTAEKSCSSAKAPDWDRGRLPLLLRGRGGCDDTGLWSGRLSGQRWHSRGILQRPRGLQGGGAENRGFRRRTSDGVCNRFLGLMQPWPGISTVLPTLTYLFPSHLCQQGQEKKMRH